MFTSKSKAKAELESVVKAYMLCPKLLGLEKASGACFSSQLGRCKGACIGRESAEAYNARVDLALKRTRIEHWPFKTPVALSTGSDDMVVVNNWIIEGYLRSSEGSDPVFDTVEPRFDLDTYRILRGFVTKHKYGLAVKPVTDEMLAQYR